MFYKLSKEDNVSVLIFYVYDKILTGDDIEELKRLKKRLGNDFDTKDLGKLKYFLIMEFERSKEGIFVNQRKCVLELLGEIGLLDCKVVETSIKPKVQS